MISDCINIEVISCTFSGMDILSAVHFTFPIIQSQVLDYHVFMDVESFIRECQILYVTFPKAQQK